MNNQQYRAVVNHGTSCSDANSSAVTVTVDLLTAGSFTVKIRNSVTNCEYTYTSNPVVLSAPTCFEICNDGIDNDGNGWTDCDDTACKPIALALIKRD